MSLLRRLLKMLRGSRGSLGDSSPAKETYSVLIMDMFHYHDPEHEYTVGGFPTLELAVEYANLDEIDLLRHTLVGMLIGAMLPFLFSAMTMRAVGRAAFSIEFLTAGGDKCRVLVPQTPCDRR